MLAEYSHLITLLSLTLDYIIGSTKIWLIMMHKIDVWSPKKHVLKLGFREIGPYSLKKCQFDIFLRY